MTMFDYIAAHPWLASAWWASVCAMAAFALDYLYCCNVNRIRLREALKK